MSHLKEPRISRRTFLLSVSVMGTGLVTGMVPQVSRVRIPHPDPRPDIDASLVISPDKLLVWPEYVREIYEKIRQIPEIADGIGCSCGCAARPTYRSLLTCYYADGMAMGCEICQGEANLVYRRAQEGQSLEQIRRAIDARFG
jgi:hypothetical protein